MRGATSSQWENIKNPRVFRKTERDLNRDSQENKVIVLEEEKIKRALAKAKNDPEFVKRCESLWSSFKKIDLIPSEEVNKIEDDLGYNPQIIWQFLKEKSEENNRE